MIPTIISQALTRPVVKVGNLDPRRDLTFVADTVEGFVGIASCDNALGQVVNIGRGEDVSIGELIEIIGRRMGKRLEVETDQTRFRPAASEVERLVACAEKAKSLFGWTSKYSLDAGIDATIAYIESHLEHYRVDAYAR